MYQIPPVVVNLRSINQRFIPVYLQGNHVIGQLEGRKQWYDLDVMTGLMESIESCEVLNEVELFLGPDHQSGNECFIISPGEAPTRHSVRRMLEMNKRRLSVNSLGYDPSRGATIPQVALRFLVALISHQVKGDELIKGLKALDINLNVKIQDNYLGGWNITCSTGSHPTVESIVDWIKEHRDE